MRQVFLATEFEGKGLATQGIQALIDKAAEVGGQVRFTPGIYETATLYMRSGVSLFIDGGARLVSTDDYTLYSNDFPNEGNPHLNEVTGKKSWHDAMIYCHGLHDIAIEGYGVVDGAYVINPNGEQNFRGPMMFEFYDCHNVRVSGLTLVRSANYFNFFDSCTDIKIENLRTFGGQDSVEVYRSQRIEIADCDFRSGDDCISGCQNADMYIHDTRCNTPGGNVILLGCRNLHIKDCKVWSQCETPALFEKDKRYSNGYTGINMLHVDALHDERYIMSDNWLIENVEFENIEQVFACNKELPYVIGNNGKVVLRNIKATNFMFPIHINMIENSDIDLTIEDSVFKRCVYDTTNASEGRVADDKAFIRANNFKKITLKNVTVEGVDEDAFHFKNGGEVVLQNVSVVKKVESADIENVKASSVTNDIPKTDGKFFLYDDVTSVYVDKEQDESFLGAKEFIK